MNKRRKIVFGCIVAGAMGIGTYLQSEDGYADIGKIIAAVATIIGVVSRGSSVSED